MSIKPSKTKIAELGPVAIGTEWVRNALDLIFAFRAWRSHKSIEAPRKRRGSGEKDHKWRSVKYPERRANIEKRPCQGNVKVAAGVFWTKRGKKGRQQDFFRQNPTKRKRNL